MIPTSCTVRPLILPSKYFPMGNPINLVLDGVFPLFPACSGGTNLVVKLLIGFVFTHQCIESLQLSSEPLTHPFHSSGYPGDSWVDTRMPLPQPWFLWFYSSLFSCQRKHHRHAYTVAHTHPADKQRHARNARSR